MKKVLIVMTFLGIARGAEACSVCFGNLDPSANKALQLGIALLLGVLAFVLGGFAVFFLKLRKRARHCIEGDVEHGF